MRRVAMVGLVLAACSPAPPSRPAPIAAPALGALGPPPAELIAALALSPFYAKHLDVDGLPVLGSAGVSDAALREAGFLIRKMIGHRPDILRAMAGHQVRVVVMAPTEMTTDVPEHSDLTPKDYWDRRARGLGATTARPATTCGEENLLGLHGDPYASENILIHELSHTVHELGVATIDPTFAGRLETAYQHARDAGLWAGTYAMTNVSEYWAEAAQSWFDTNRVDDHDHGSIATREQVVEYDREVAALLTEVYGADAWRYQRPDQRAAEDTAHLAGFDRISAPRFVWPEQVPAEIEVLALLAEAPGPSPSGGAETSILFVNQRDRDVAILWIDFAGELVPYATVRPGATHAQSTFAGHTWLVRDGGGTELGYVVAAASPGRIELP